MYHIKYKPEGGKVLNLSREYGYLINTVQGATGHSVFFDLSQGVDQIGQDVRGMYLEGQTVYITGKIPRGNTYAKNTLLRAFSPLSRGRLIFEDKYFLDVVVKDSPTVTQEKHSAFGMRLFAPFPYWQSVKENRYGFKRIEKKFFFPVNYSEPHMFGETIKVNPFPVSNRGDVPAAFSLVVTAGENGVSDFSVADKKTGKSLRFLGDLEAGDTLELFRDKGMLYVRLNGENAFDLLDDESDLLDIPVGDSVLELSDSSVTASLVFREAYSGVLADGV